MWFIKVGGLMLWASLLTVRFLAQPDVEQKEKGSGKEREHGERKRDRRGEKERKKERERGRESVCVYAHPEVRINRQTHCSTGNNSWCI